MLINPPTSSSPPPPPGSHGQKLAELLEEQQEPFALEVYLLDKGYHHHCCYSERFLASSQAAAICRWPMGACEGLLRRLQASHGLARRKRMKKRCHRLLKSLLAMLLNPKAVRKDLNGAGDNKVLHFSGAIDDGGDGWKWMEADDSNQLSPVSVLDLSYAKPKKLLEEEEEEEEDDDDDEEMLAWKKKKLEGVEVESIRQLALTDIFKSKREWYEFHPHAREIGTQIEEAIFEEIKEDVILELLGLISM